MKKNVLNLNKSVSQYFIFLGLLTSLSAIFYNLIIYRVQPFEFDTSVYFVILENFITTGKILIPIVSRSIASICDPLLICSYVHPTINGQQIYEQLPPDYTSGITLLIIPKLINSILSLFNKNTVSLNYFIELYAASAAFIYFISSAFLLKFSKLSIDKILIYSLVTFISNLLLIQFAANGIVGELYSSLLLSAVAVIIFLTINSKNQLALNITGALLLGVALECKITSIFPVFFIFLIIIVKDFYDYKNFRRVASLIVAISLPKLIAFLYYCFVLDFNMGNLINFYKSSLLVYSINANAGLNWGESSVLKQLKLLFSNHLINSTIYFSIACLGMGILINLGKRNKELLLITMYVLCVLISALIYPLNFKFPYTRIYSAFFSLVPLCLLVFILTIQQFSSRKIYQSVITLIFLIPITLHTYLIRPASMPFFHRAEISKFEGIGDVYPNLIIPEGAIFLTTHFFSMPWDAYLSSKLGNDPYLRNHSIYSEQSYGINSSHGGKLNVGDIYLLETCRWGHCSNKDFVEKNVKTNFDQKNTKLNCTLLKSTNKLIYRIYKCESEKY